MPDSSFDLAVGFASSLAGLIELTGPDARSFLHNLCTNDIQLLTPGQGREMFLATHKARAIAHGVVTCFRRDEADVFWLDVAPERAEAAFRHLDHYLISEQVELTNRSADFGTVRLLGAKATTTLAQVEVFAEAMMDSFIPWQFAALANGLSLRRQGAFQVAGFDLFGPIAEVAGLIDRLARAGVQALPPEVHEATRIESGWPAWGRELDENRFIVETGRIAQAICYTKGCYLGQEPIVMARDRGQVNRKLMGLLFAGDRLIPAGTKVMQGEIEIARITSSALSPAREQGIALAYLWRGHQEPGTTLTIPDTVGGGTAVISALPLSET